MLTNPYDSSGSPAALESKGGSLDPTTRSLWLAYAIAPATAPLSFAMLLIGVAVVASLFGVEVNPASLLVMPVVALTLGLLASYAVAATVGMPIAFYLRRRKALSFYTIHLAAFLWSVVLATLLGFVVGGEPWYVQPLVALYFLAGIAPPVLLSATVFWLLLRRKQPPSGRM